MNTNEEFWARVSNYKKLGLDPLRWVAGCAVKVDLTTVIYPALHMIKPELEKLGVTINPREDADIFHLREDEIIVKRAIYDFKEPRVDTQWLADLSPTRALSLVQVHQKHAGNPEEFGNQLTEVYKRLSEANIKFTVGKGHSIISPYPDDEFALFEFVREGTGRPSGFTLANNDTIQVIDPMDDPGSQSQAFVAISNALNDLIALGCFENLRAYPVYDAPSDEMVKAIEGNMKQFSQQHNVRIEDTGPLRRGRLLIGASVIGDMYKQPPTHYDFLTPGMQILVTRAFGDLAPINTYLSCVADEDYLNKLEQSGHSLEDVRKAKESAIKVMMEPNLRIGQIINGLCPEFGDKFKENEHVAATGDLSGPGIYIFKELADIAKAEITLDKIPLAFPEYVKFATESYLMDNGTAGTNGAIAMIASEEVIKSAISSLERQGHRPQIIGQIIRRGEPKLIVPKEVENFIASKSILNEMTIAHS